MNEHKSASIQVNGGGSGTGIAALLNGTINIANASRELKPSEYEQAKASNINPIEHKVALDGIAIIVHPSNTLKEVSLEQLKNIFSGKIKNWKELGGPNAEIVLYGRENSSGTYEFFKEHVLGKDQNGKQVDYATSTQVLPGTAALAQAVAQDKNGIAYGGVGYFAMRDDIKILSVKKDADSPAILPSKDGKVNYEAIWNGDYSISRYLYCYTNGEPTGEAKNFLDFIVSPEGQKLVEQMEYIPLPNSTK
jgi:phosphate transport system substrate-binding protein